MPTYAIDRHVSPAEATLARIVGLKHAVFDVRSSAATITLAKTGGKIVIESLDIATDSSTAMTLAITCTGANTRTLRIAATSARNLFGGVFCGADAQNVVLTPAGYTAGTYAELCVVYYEV